MLSALLILALLLGLSACGGGSGSSGDGLEADPQKRCAALSGLTYDHSMELSYATQFAADYFKEGPCLLTVADGRQYLVVPDGGALNGTDVPADITVLNAPVRDVYLAGSASMDYFVHCGALSSVAFSALRQADWKLPDAAAAMEDGAIRYAGKYSAPDYELLTTGNCGLAVENTMIYHSPAIIEKLEELSVPVFIDCSSREKTPEGRMEWVRLYGVLTGQEKAAEKAFRAQEKEFRALEKEQTGRESDPPVVAFFSVKANGTVTVRRSTDYIPYMIGLAGGQYLFEDLGADEDSNRATETVSMETFYAAAKDADYFIYNSTIEGERQSIAQLLKDAPVLADCKAVRDGNVYCTTADLYQNSMGQGTFVRDLWLMLNGEDDTGMTYLFRLAS